MAALCFIYSARCYALRLQLDLFAASPSLRLVMQMESVECDDCHLAEMSKKRLDEQEVQRVFIGWKSRSGERNDDTWKTRFRGRSTWDLWTHEMAIDMDLSFTESFCNC